MMHYKQFFFLHDDTITDVDKKNARYCFCVFCFVFFYGRDLFLRRKKIFTDRSKLLLLDCALID